jgi:DNA-binding CsgD family transcriptional regulator
MQLISEIKSGIDYAEIAKQLGVSINVVKSVVYRYKLK